MSTPSLKVGDRVYLISKTYIPAQLNPVKGSKYERKGTVREVEPMVCLVQWDNGAINNYVISTDLMLVDTVDTDYKSIW